ncbi:CBS domain-containing protein [Methanococcoides burtonii]|uniref:Cystathionine beta-synthase domain-containing protein n=1 Tax=Methanococcoides burtonii (strain DSM 6242 / NBRC 107633 / OCM 468 / ACE-M) TaxID=259564 RepID=Q12V73_METBU|nr:CBS domain-containing protein [Methanococcoides burtonii]ABE52653.1 Cystathionine beta-synthase domain-containing protein [Methanococcoides burtonii DSM 6242]
MVMVTKGNIAADGSIKETLKDVAVHEIMTKDVFILDVTSTTLEVAKAMDEQNIDSVIITKYGEATGIITERDMVCKVMVKDVIPHTVNAEEIMSSPILTVKPNTGVIKASEMMVKFHIRRLAVTNGKAIVGLVTDRDILTVSPGLNTILEDLIEINSEQDIVENIGIERGICQRCGSHVDDLIPVNGLILCEDCREEEDE